MNGSLECTFNMILQYEYKWYPVLIIVGILLYVIEGKYVALALVVGPHDHVIHITFGVITIQV